MKDYLGIPFDVDECGFETQRRGQNVPLIAHMTMDVTSFSKSRLEIKKRATKSLDVI